MKHSKIKLWHWPISALACLIILEGIFRLWGFALMVPSMAQNAVRQEDESAFRILALGESTTADPLTDSAWPRQLEKKLQERKLTVRVYNEGRSGTMSPFIVARVPALLKKYRPDVVVAMMGVNDTLGLTYVCPNPEGVMQALSDLRLLKISRWIWMGIKGRYYQCRFTNAPLPSDAMLDHAIELAQTQSVDEVERELRRNLSSDEDVAQALVAVVKGVRTDFADRTAREKALPFSLRAFQLAPRNMKAAYWVLHNDSISNQDCVKISEDLLHCADSLSDGVLSAVASCAVRSSHQADLALPEGFNFVATDQKLTATQHRRMHDILKESGVTFVDMQYPTRELEKLQKYFYDSSEKLGRQYQDVIFISNQKNFAKALKKKAYNEIFTDHFRQDWGHTTAYGNSLIADQLVPVISDLYAKKKSSD